MAARQPGKRQPAGMGADLRPSTRREHDRWVAQQQAEDAADAAGQQPPAAGPGIAPAAGEGRAGPARGAARPGQALAGLIVGMFAWGYALNWIRGGIAQANGWLAAKFLNRPYAAGPAQGAAPGPTAATSGSGGGGGPHMYKP